MKVSVIVPVYNSENTIKKTINSILNQTYKDIEIVIVNDGSIDKTDSIINNMMQYTSKIVYYKQENAGVSAARNKGIELATGIYISFLDSDDTFEPTFIEKMIKAIQKCEAEISYCGYKVVTHLETKKRKSSFGSNNTLKNYILEKIIPNTCCWLISKDYIIDNKLRFLEGVSWGEDFEFFSNILARGGKVTSVPEYLTNYYVGTHVSNLSDYSIDKIDKDYDSIMRLINTEEVTNVAGTKKALLNYRLPALIVYNLHSAIKLGISREIISDYYTKYKKIIAGFSYINGLRSFKLNLYRIRVKFALKKL